MIRLDDKVAVVTGGGSGIGRATAILFARAGAKVIVADFVAKGGNETVRIITEAGGDAIFVKTDVSKAADVEKLVSVTVDTYGKLDILCNNAGVCENEGLVAEVQEETWNRIIDINLKGVFLGMKYCIPEMLKSGGGVIVNTASTASLIAWPELPAYCASKGGVLMLTKAAAIGYAKRNIRVNCVCPGPIGTPMLAKICGSIEEANEIYNQRVPMGRVGRPDEIAAAILFLACDESSYATGTALVIDGGDTAV